MKLPQLLATAIAFLCLSSPSQACNVPVFRYALEKWKPDAYRVHVFHRGVLSSEHSALVKTLRNHGPDEKVVCNLDLKVVPLLWPDGEGFEHALMTLLTSRHVGQLGGLDDLDVLVAETQHALAE